MKKILIIFLLFLLTLSAQEKKLKVGFSLSSYGFIIGNGNSKIETEFSSLQFPFIYNLNLAYIVHKNISINAKLGFILPVTYYNGFEYALSGNYNINKNYYVSTGIMQHSNSENEEGAIETNIIFIDTGLGYKVSKYFSIEVIYFYPLNESQIWNGNIDLPNIKNPKYIRRIESMIYLNFVFGWDL